MASHKLSNTTCALKVNIQCCTSCPEKAMKKLRKMDGVDSVSYDAEKKMLIVSGNGNIDPVVLIKKFEKWGKKADLYSFENGQVSSSSKENIQDKELDESSDCDDDHGENFDVHAPKKHGDRSISWQHPRLVKNPPPQEASPVNKQTTRKKSKWFLGGLLGKKEEEPRKTDNKNGAKWHFPRTSMPAYRPPGPYGAGAPPFHGERTQYMNQYGPGAPPFHGERPQYMNQYPTMMPPGLIQPLQLYGYGYGSMLPRPPPLPYGPFHSRLPPRMNPMIHYTDYKDNYYY